MRMSGVRKLCGTFLCMCSHRPMNQRTISDQGLRPGESQGQGEGTVISSDKERRYARATYSAGGVVSDLAAISALLHWTAYISKCMHERALVEACTDMTLGRIATKCMERRLAGRLGKTTACSVSLSLITAQLHPRDCLGARTGIEIRAG
jgi:hypothetical protein